MSLSTDIIKTKNREVLNQIANKCDEEMGHILIKQNHHPFSKDDFKSAVDEILTDNLGRDYMSTPIHVNRNEIVADVVNWLADYLGDY